MYQLSAVKLRNILLPLVAIITLSCKQGNNPSNSDEIHYFCGAENLVTTDEGEFFQDGDQGKFIASGHRVTDSVFEGQYAIMLDSAQQYGMSLRLTDIAPGTYFESSVWIKNPIGKGTLIAGINGHSNYTLNTGPVNKMNDSLGWSQYFLNFGVETPVDTITFFLFSGSERRYFDNFEIKQYAQRPELPDSLKAEALQIYLPDSAEEILSSYKKQALEQKVVSADLKEFVEGFVIYNGDSIPAEIRLKGDWTDHLESGKTSYRIKLDQPFRGMTEFSIQHPQTRNFMHEWFMHRLCTSEDLLSTTYEYIPVEINGISQGIYALEEHFNEHLLESHQRVAGPILKLDESGFWGLLASGMKDSLEGSYPYYPASMITCFKEGRTEKSKSLSKEFEIGSRLLYQFKNFYQYPEELFDMDQIARFYALMDLGNVNHALAWHNRRFYYNPITAKLELIGFDMIPAVLPINRLHPQQMFPYAAAPINQELSIDYHLYANDAFRKSYAMYMNRFSSEAYLDSVFQALDREIVAYENLLHVEFPGYKLNRAFYYEKAEACRKDLNTLDKEWDRFDAVAKKSDPKFIEPNYPELEFPFLLKEISVNAYRNKVDSAHYQLQLENFHLAEISVTGYTTKQKGDTVIHFPTAVSMSRYDGLKAASYVEIVVEGKPDEIYFTAANTGSTVYSRKVFNWPRPTGEHPRNELRKKFKTSHPLYTIVQDTLFIRRGRHELHELIYIPEKYVAVVEPGSLIDMRSGGGLIFNQSLFIRGTENQPVVFYSSDSSSQGLVVLNNRKTEISHCYFQNLDALDYEDWELNGSVTIYGGEVNLDQVVVENCRGDDAMNLVRTHFNAKNLTFKNARKDALDADFSDGTLTHGIFVNTPKDCIDSVGSTILLEDITINNSNLEGGTAGDYDMLRIENEIKLTVPVDIADSVWAYLLRRYDNENLYLRETDTLFNSKMAEDLFIDQYFDDDYFHVLQSQNGIRHRTRIVLSDPNSRKNGRELIQLKVNNISSNELNRAEYKYPVKYYEEKSEMWDKHPFLGIAQRKYRQELTDRLATYGLDATSLHPTVRLRQMRRRVYLYRDLDPFATLTLDDVTGYYEGDSSHFVELELELNEINYTEGDSTSRTEMEAINDDIKSDLLERFPSIKQDQTPKYNKAAQDFDIQPRAILIADQETENNKPLYLLLMGGGFAITLALVFINYRRRQKRA